MEEIGEAELVAAAREGRVIDGSDGGERARVDADVLRRCCHDLKAQVDPRGIQLRRVAVAGTLDLAGVDLPFPLRFDDCEFDSPLVIDGAQLYDLALTGCVRLPGLLANGVRVRRDLDLSRTTVTGAHQTSASTSKRAAIWLCESEIGGRLLCVDTVIEGSGERSIQGDRIRVGGNIRLLHHFTARGEIRLIGANIGGSLDLTGARIESAMTGLALDLGEAVIDGSIFLIDDSIGRRPELRGRIDMGRARIGGQFLVRNAVLAAGGALPVGSAYSRARGEGTAVSAPRLSVGAEVTLEGHCQVTGGIDLAMSELSSMSIGPDCSLAAPGHVALDLTNAELLSTFTVGARAHVEGTISLRGAHVRGNVRLRGANLSKPAGNSLLAAQGLKADGEVELQEVHATGGDLAFRGAVIGSWLDAGGAQLHNSRRLTLSLREASIKGSVRLVDGFRSTGQVVLNRASIEGRLVFKDGWFDCPAPNEFNGRGDAIEAFSATVRSGMDLGWASVSPSVDFSNTQTSSLADDPLTWPPRFIIGGFTYDRFTLPQGRRTGDPWDHAARCAWLARQAAYDAGPYEQAARVFRQHGYTSGADQISIAQHQHARQTLTGRGSLARRALDGAYSLTVAYGYRPGRVLWLLLALLVLVTGSLDIPATQATMRATNPAGQLFSTRGPLPDGATQTPGSGPGRSGDACGNGEVRCFNEVFYAIDTVIPLVTLDQRSTWYPDPHARYGTVMEWWLNTATILGWLLSSIFVLSLARLARGT
jgi:hypothetical protein